LIENEKKSELVWKLLFFSTIWSFIWSITTSLLFFPYIGVSKTIVLNWLILSCLSLWILLLNKKYFKDIFIYITMFFITLFSYLIYSDLFNSNTVYSFNSTHNDIDIVDYDVNKRIMLLNGAYSSWIYKDTKESYFRYIVETQSLLNEIRPKNVLVIWWAGFTFPYYISKLDFIENVDVSDIDSELYNISQKYFLEEKFNNKIKFYWIPAEYLITQKSKEWKKYDFIFIDAYTWKSVPSQLLTKEFYEWLKQISNWVIIFNYIFDQDKSSTYYKKTINTLLTTMWNVYMKWASDFIWQYWNFLVINKKYNWYEKVDDFKDEWIYTDDKWTQEIDKYQLFKDNY
jgi:spermidine synthase